AIFQSSMTK
nr:Chain C, nonamer reverse transcriptase (AIFQSSMTK) [Human immunodeficiency virus type 1 (Z2/CDC-Z34 ISOLATE)]1Q94_F Chain F, nonamer reverse transcriptase (AIFQSSMTK) [Human immunodeficiency virus type 1 (Z2/CDC-Z34 ISOLATE)]3RL1_C Chain C, RT313 peptide [Human immunodeficiency virus 1]4HWZ_C Chain C, 9-mer peptide from Pol protein [Human immunodeficiency virus 1]6ID4_T Chain T, peptide [Human immunodeficiency virus 1]6ID4_U Chain U, peptide [Human immunodeficiency virus 1]6J1V_C Chain C, 